MTFFSSLDRRKEAKEDQGVRDAGQIWPGTYLEASNLGKFSQRSFCYLLVTNGLTAFFGG